MAYFKVEKNKIVGGPYPKRRCFHKNTSIGENTTDEELKALGFLPQVKIGENDPVDPGTEVKERIGNKLEADRVTTTWRVRKLTPKEISDRDNAITLEKLEVRVAALEIQSNLASRRA